MKFWYFLISELLIIGIVGALLYFTIRTINYVYGQIRLPRETRKKLLSFFGIGFLCWLAVLSLLARLQFFDDFEAFPPRLLFAFFPPIVFVFLLLRSRFFKLLLRLVPMQWPVRIQAFRVFLDGFWLLAFQAGLSPFQLTLLGLNQDWIVGITALTAAWIFFRRGRILKWQATLWHVFGVLLLSNVLFTMLISLPYQWQFFAAAPDASFITAVPFIWIPGFLYPFAFGLHLFSLWQIWRPTN